MNVSVTDRFTAMDAAELYGLEGWGNGYFSIREDGHLLVTPDRDPSRGIDLYGVVRKLVDEGFKTPLLLRFPQLLERQVQGLTSSFQRAIDEYGYAGSYMPVFPVKVNQQRLVVEGLLESGAKYGLGLEAGSRPELMAAAALETSPQSLIICNGFKDYDYLASASLATRLGKHVVVVIEKPFELDQVLEMAAEGCVVPMIGFRLRLQARGSGLWEKSGGVASKFGLTTLQLLRSLQKLDKAGLGSKVSLLHFHIGSQITEIRKIKSAIHEAGRIYAKVRKLGVGLRYLDVGGGLGVDYDGSKTSSDASLNYNVQEYANDVVFGIHEVCEQEEIPAPILLSESGRMLTAYHSLLVTDVRGSITGLDPCPLEITGDEQQVVEDLAEVSRNISVKNYRESSSLPRHADPPPQRAALPQGDAGRHNLRFGRRCRQVRRSQGDQGGAGSPRSHPRPALLPRLSADRRISGHHGGHAQSVRPGQRGGGPAGSCRKGASRESLSRRPCCRCALLLRVWAR